jgi:uncharacterized protein (DUF2147 family)
VISLAAQGVVRYRYPEAKVQKLDGKGDIMIKFMAGVALLLLWTGGALGAADDILGQWKNEDGRARIEIFHCGPQFCGKISWLGRPFYTADDPKGMAGKPRVDRENPNPELRTRPLLGLQIMEGFTYKGGATWEQGSIYDPDSGKTYTSKMTLVSPGKLKIRGYVGIPLLGRTTSWTRE